MANHPITVTGNVVAHPHLTRTRGGNLVARFRVASSRRSLTRELDGEGRPVWADADTLYLEVETWGDLAFNVRQTLTRGTPVVVVGVLVTHEWVTDERRNSRIILKGRSVAVDLNRIGASLHPFRITEHLGAGDDVLARGSDLAAYLDDDRFAGRGAAEHDRRGIQGDDAGLSPGVADAAGAARAEIVLSA